MALTKRVNQRVVSNSPKFPGLGTITKVNPVNIKVRMDSGRNVNFHPMFLADAPADGSIPDGTPGPLSVSSLLEFKPPLQPGQVVTVKGLDGLFTVQKDNVEKVKLAKLFGDDGKYYPGVPRTLVSDPLTRSEVLDQLL